MDEQVIMLAADEETMQEVEDTIDSQEQFEQGRQFFDTLCLEYQVKEVMSEAGGFEAILDNLTDQGALTGFSAFVFIAQVTQQRLALSSLKTHLKKKSARSILRKKQGYQRH